MNLQTEDNQKKQTRGKNDRLMSTSTVTAALFSDTENVDDVCDEETGHIAKKEENQVKKNQQYQ